jgi:hypothetical protein
MMADEKRRRSVKGTDLTGTRIEMLAVTLGETSVQAMAESTGTAQF